VDFGQIEFPAGERLVVLKDTVQTPMPFTQELSRRSSRDVRVHD